MPGQPSFAAFALALTFVFTPLLNAQPPRSDAVAWELGVTHGYLPYRRLALEDFRIDDRVHRENGIYTAGFFHYAYKHRCKAKSGRVIALVTEWVVRSGFDRNKSSRKSWFSAAERFLEHEQGHLDINELHSRRLANMGLSALPMGRGRSCEEASADLKEKLQALAEKCSREAQAEQDRYDRETGRGTDALKQEEATAELKARLRKAAITYPDG